jgi:hypothetical protein
MGDTIPSIGNCSLQTLKNVYNKVYVESRKYLNVEGKWTGAASCNVNGIELSQVERGDIKQ